MNTKNRHNDRHRAVEKQIAPTARTILLTAIALALGVSGSLTSTTATAAPPAFREVTANVPAHFRAGPKVKPGRSRAVRIDPTAIDRDSITLNLFNDTSLTVVKDRIVQNGKGHSAWIGHIEDEPESEVILALRGKALMGTIKRGDEAYDIVYAGNDVHVVRQIDLNAEAPHSEPVPISDAEMAAAAASDGTTSATPATAAAATGNIIDFMVVYTPQARINAGGTAGIEAKIINAVTAANQSYLNSQVNMQLNLVHMEEVAYTETGNMSTTLTDLTGTADGKMDNIHALRNTYGADQVALVSADSNYCGIAYQMQTLSTSFSPWAFSVVHDDSRYSCLGNLTLAHELGHNQGNAHDAANSVGYPGITAYSYGYRVCGVFRTVMAYSCSGESRISNFANPNVFYVGQPTGIAGSADTASSMNYAALTVANFRATASTTAPNAPSNLAAASASSSSINLSWSDNSSDETGFIVQRSTDGVTWTQIANLGSNVRSFSSTGLSPGTPYSHRVYAYNSIGNSGLSNVATATTGAAIIDTTPPSVSILKPTGGSKVSGTVAISVTASDNVAVQSLKLYVNGKLVSSTASSSLNYNWNTRKAAAGNHVINARAADTAGNVGNQSISVTK
jgi:hypothetical protein